jgi:hypothetical protein
LKKELQKSFGILLHERFISSPSLIYSSIYISMDSGTYTLYGPQTIFYSLGYNPYLIFSVVQILVLVNRSSVVIASSDIPPAMQVFAFGFEYFLSHWHYERL